MTTIPYWHVDAFADAPFRGNQAAVMPLDQWLPDDVLQAIGEENAFAETAFIIPDASGQADYELRWFTPTEEVRLCGHATLASGHVLIGDRDAIRFRTRHAGVLTVARAGAGYALSLPAWDTEVRPLPDLAAGMGGDVLETRWRDGGYALFVYRDAAAIRALTPDFAALRPAGDLLLMATAPGDDSDIISRVFVPGGGVDEDPVTGSAHGLLTPYWAARLGKTDISAFQASARGGRLGCTLAGDRVVLTGGCRTVIEGRFLL